MFFWRMAAFMCVLCGASHATTYYVGMDGDDGDGGTSAETAWRTLGKVQSRSFNPGDAVLLQRGGQWREMLYILDGGSSGAPFVLGAYGSGAAPIISGADVVTGWAAEAGVAGVWRAGWAADPGALWFFGDGGACMWGRRVESPLVLSGGDSREYDWAWASGVLYVRAGQSPESGYGSVEAAARDYCVVGGWYRNLGYVEVRELELRCARRQCLRIEEGNHSWTIEQVTAHHNGMSGETDMLAICLYGDHHVVRGCTVYEAVGNGITVVLGKGCLIERNVTYNNHHNQIDVKPAAAGDTNIVRYNHVYLDGMSGQVAGISSYSVGIYVVGLSDGCAPTQIHYNVVHDVYLRGIQVDGNAEASICNNVVVNSADYDFYINNGEHAAVLKNNIAYNTGGDSNRILRVCDTPNKVIDYNCWRWLSGVFTQVGYYVDYYNWNRYRSLTGFDAHSLAQEPRLVNVAGGDYHLEAASPCIDKGMDVGLTQDYEGVAVPRRAGVDMGAFEFPDGQYLPDADFGASPVAGLAPLTVQFTDSSRAGAGVITNWAWDFGDGAQVSGMTASPAHVYTRSGLFTVRLTVTTGLGADSETKAGFIDVEQGSGPSAQFTAWPRSGLRPLTVQFADLSVPGSGAIKSWAWDFGDGSTSARQSPAHIYTGGGRYPVSLTVTTEIGSSTIVQPDYVDVFDVVYVDKDSTGVEDGLTWGTAYRTLQPAIDKAAGAERSEVWVAEGSYGERRSGDGAGALVMRPSVSIYGGFTGTETQRTQRNWQEHRAVIDGATSRGGAQAYHVVRGCNNGTLDGFVIRNGDANGFFDSSGGGMLNDSASPTVANCVFENNRASNAGGAMYTRAGAPVVTGCTFIGNATRPTWMFTTYVGGGAIHNRSSSPAIRRCVFIDNEAPNTSGGCGGGAVYNHTCSGVEITECVFTGNSADRGGGIYNYQSTPELVNCLFASNAATGGGGAVCCHESNVSLMNCTVAGNRASDGAGIYGNGCTPKITNCILWDNVPDQLSGPATVTYSNVAGESVYPGAGNIHAAPLFAEADDYRLRAPSPCVDHGTAADAPGRDLRDVVRPQGAGIDMGAYEFAANELPRVDFQAFPSFGKPGLRVTFVDMSTPGAYGEVLSWDWDFGDGSRGEKAYTSHVYAKPGCYTVSLSVTNAVGTHVLTKPDLITVVINLPLESPAGLALQFVAMAAVGGILLRRTTGHRRVL